MALRPGRPPATATRQAILASAIESIARDGFHALRVRQVAEHAGVNHATLLHHFPSKDALIDGVLGAVETTLAPRMTHEPPADPMMGLQGEFADAVQRLETRPHEFAVVLELLLAARQRPEIRKLTARLYANWRTEVADLIRRGQEAGVFQPGLSPPAGAELITTHLTGMALTTLAGSADQSPAILAEIAWRWVSSWLLTAQ